MATSSATGMENGLFAAFPHFAAAAKANGRGDGAAAAARLPLPLPACQPPPSVRDRMRKAFVGEYEENALPLVYRNGEANNISGVMKAQNLRAKRALSGKAAATGAISVYPSAGNGYGNFAAALPAKATAPAWGVSTTAPAWGVSATAPSLRPGGLTLGTHAAPVNKSSGFLAAGRGWGGRSRRHRRKKSHKKRRITRKH